MKHHKKYIVFIAPSSEDEYRYSECDTVEQAIDVRIEGDSSDIYSFDTIQEVEAFVEGYKSALGCLGELNPIVGINKDIEL